MSERKWRVLGELAVLVCWLVLGVAIAALTQGCGETGAAPLPPPRQPALAIVDPAPDADPYPDDAVWQRDLAHLDRFPPPAAVAAEIARAGEHLRRLGLLRDLDPPRLAPMWAAVAQECRRRLWQWEQVAVAQDAARTACDRQWHLFALYAMTTPADWCAGRLPPAVPPWQLGLTDFDGPLDRAPAPQRKPELTCRTPP